MKSIFYEREFKDTASVEDSFEFHSVEVKCLSIRVRIFLI